MTNYNNGGSEEKVYSDLNLTTQIGTLNPHETCECIGIAKAENGKSRAIIMYRIGNTNNYKVGFVGWMEGVEV